VYLRNTLRSEHTEVDICVCACVCMCVYTVITTWALATSVFYTSLKYFNLSPCHRLLSGPGVDGLQGDGVGRVSR